MIQSHHFERVSFRVSCLPLLLVSLSLYHLDALSYTVVELFLLFVNRSSASSKSRFCLFECFTYLIVIIVEIMGSVIERK